MLFLLKLKEYNSNHGIKVNGLTDPALIASLPLRDDYARPNKFIEVVMSNSNHWVCVASGLPMDPADGPDVDISLFDSMPRTYIDAQLGTTCALMVSQDRLRNKSHLTFRVPTVQEQKSDLCGYYALANAMALCLGLDPEMLVFNESDLREHFISVMFDQKPMSMFPHEKMLIKVNQLAKYQTFQLEGTKYHTST